MSREQMIEMMSLIPTAWVHLHLHIPTRQTAVDHCTRNKQKALTMSRSCFRTTALCRTFHDFCIFITTVNPP